MRDVLPVIEAVAREAAERIGVELISVRCHRLAGGGTRRGAEDGRASCRSTDNYGLLPLSALPASRRSARRKPSRRGEKPLEGSVRVSVCIHREGGTSIGDCEEVSRFVERHLDEAAVIPGSYLLEVMSRGITLPDPSGAREGGKGAPGGSRKTGGRGPDPSGARSRGGNAS